MTEIIHIGQVVLFSEPPFLGTQAEVVLIFIVLAILAAKRFPAEAVHAA